MKLGENAMLQNTIREQLNEAMKAGDTTRKNILRVFLGEIQKSESLGKGVMSDDGIYNIARKLIKSNEEAIEYLEARKKDKDAAKVAELEAENAILTAFLPATLTEAELLATLTAEPLLSQIRGARANGRAIGMAMKHFKDNDIDVIGNEVAEVVAKVRGMSDKDVMGFRLVKRLIEKPEILDDLRQRIENEEIVDWDGNPAN
jgi:uncharacterized protein YqeY